MFQTELEGFNTLSSKKRRLKCFIWKTEMNHLKNVWSFCERELWNTASRVLPGCRFFFSLAEEYLNPHCKRCRTSREGTIFYQVAGGGGWTAQTRSVWRLAETGMDVGQPAASVNVTERQQIRAISRERWLHTACYRAVSMCEWSTFICRVWEFTNRSVQYSLPNQNN